MAFTVAPADAQCMTIALVVLPDSALVGMITFMDTVIANFKAYMAIFQAEIVNLDIILLPLVIEKNKLLEIQQTILAQFKILDQSIVIQCPSLGTLSQVIMSSADRVTEGITNTLNVINMKEAIRLQYQNQVDSINSYINFLGQVKSILQNILQIRTQAKIVGQLPALLNSQNTGLT
jgi:hypothetical protein